MCVVILGVGWMEPDPHKILGEKIAIFECLIDISSMNDHKNLGVGTLNPRGDVPPYIFLTVGHGDAY